MTGAERLGKRLTELRAASGLSLRELAAKLGLKHHGDFSLFESGRRVMPAKHVKALARIYGVDVMELEALQRAAAHEVRTARAVRAAGLKADVGGPVANVDARDRTPLLVGRSSVMDELAGVFAAVVPAGAACALVGMPGVGKSQLALHFAHRHAQDYDLVWRLQATEPATVPMQLARLAGLLGVNAGDRGDVEAAEAVVEALSNRGRWLLIVDDAQNPDDVRQLCVTDRGGHVLITSRWSTWRSVGLEIAVQPLSVDDSVQFLLERTGNRGDPTGIAEALGGLPLALEQAGSLIEHLGLPFADYLAFLSERPSEALRRGAPAYASASAGAAQTLDAAIGEAVAANAESARTLAAASLVGDAPIPIDLFPPNRMEVSASALSSLATRNLVRLSDEGVHMHELLQLAARARLSQEDVRTALDSLVNRLVELLPTDVETRSDAARFASLLPHVVAIAAHRQNDRLVGLALSRSGAALDALGQAERGEKLVRQAVNIFRSTNESALLADALHNLAGICDETDRSDEAIHHLDESLALRQLVEPRDDLKIAATKGMLGQALDARDPARGETLLREALGELTALVGSDHPFTIVTLGNLSLAIEVRGDHQEATRLRTEALARAEDTLGEDHPVTAGALVNLALSADSSLAPAQRRLWCERAIAVRAMLAIDDETQAELLETLRELDGSVG